jgi:nickel-dependent lactate racemase
VAKYLRDLLQEKQISTRNIRMVGGGGSCLVFKINDMVIKLGEERNDRRVYINHRILASLVRKLEQDKEGNDLFYVEIMKYAITGDVTKEERDELRKDLYDMGLVWTDDKLANCGVLMDDDDNYYDREIDYSEFAGHVDCPIKREEFAKRKRRVVVIDNDHIRFNTSKSCK